VTPEGLTQLKIDEGCRLLAYPDPLTGGEPLTIGYGHTGGVLAGERWTQDEADATILEDVAKAEASLDRALPWWRTLDAERQDVLANMAFNMGISRLLGFAHMLRACQAGDYETAANEMLDSRWAEQVPHRASRLAGIMRNG